MIGRPPGPIRPALSNRNHHEQFCRGTGGMTSGGLKEYSDVLW